MTGRVETALGMERHRGPAAVVAKVVIYGVLMLIFAGPLLGLLISSFELVRDPTKFTVWPHHPTLQNYRVASARGIWHYLLNSLIVVGGGLLLQVTVTIFAGYALARKRFRGATVVLLLILTTMMLPEEILAIPLSLVLSDLPVVHLNLIDTLWGMIIPVGAWGFSIIVMAEFMKEIPVELDEAARIDGAGEFRLFWSVVLPLSRPALGIVGIFGFSMIWDQYILPLIVAKDAHNATLALALRTLRSDDQVGLGVLLAGAVLALVPSVVVFLSFQRQFMRGLTMGAVKG
jgi:multiple sugar transport system permease protein